MRKETEQILSNIDFENIEKHPNILIAARFWDDQRFHAARVCYKFMRMIDDYIDDRRALNREISCLEKEELSEKVHSWIECLDSSQREDPFYAELNETITTFKIPLQLFHNFAKSMLFDINNNGFSSMEEFIEYSEGASVAPASIFVHLCCLSEENGEYRVPEYNVLDMARPCALFSYLVHIIRDFQEDQLNSLNYFAEDILAKNNLSPSDLRIIAQTESIPDSFRSVIREYCDQARIFEEQTLQVLNRIDGELDQRNLMSLHVIYSLYKMVFQRIDPESGNFTTSELNPTPLEIREKVMEVVSMWQ